MGLDMYLKKIIKVPGNDFAAMMDMEERIDDIVEAKGEEFMKVQPYITKSEFGWYHLAEEVGYWRKANQIHAWFVKIVQNSIDECEPHQVTKEQVEQLLSICKRVEENHDSASELLPTQSGFFFGDTSYSEYYFDDIKSTIQILESLKDFDYDNYYLYYRSSW